MFGIRINTAAKTARQNNALAETLVDRAIPYLEARRFTIADRLLRQAAELAVDPALIDAIADVRRTL